MKTQRGFTLVEIAIVLLIVTILLGYTVALFPVQQELKQYRHAEREMDQIIESLIAFAQVNGRLPCPDTTAVNPAYDGVEDRTAGLNDCDASYGFLPARTLGINGDIAANGVLLDPWGVGYGYAVSEADAGDGNVDLVTTNGIRSEGIAAIQPDLFICDGSTTTGDHTDCTAPLTGGAEVLGSNGGVAAVIVSLGKNNDPAALSNVEDENFDDFDDGGNDKVYIFAPRADDYDDIVKWLPTNLLISKMIEADQLP